MSLTSEFLLFSRSPILRRSACGTPWARGCLPITSRLYDIGGGYNIPVSCVGAAVLPGYAVLTDASGVLFIAPDDLEQQINIAEQKTERGGTTQAKVATGEKLGTLYGASRMVISKK